MMLHRKGVPEELTRDQWLERLGFQFNPFEYEAADELEGGDPHLDKYFVPFPYYEELKSARSTILFTRRGCGKSANRLKLERWCQETLRKPQQLPNILAVRHDDFLAILTNISLDAHVQAILQRAVPSLLEAWVYSFPGAEHKLSAAAYEDLAWFVQNYSGRLLPAGLQRRLKKAGAQQTISKGPIQATASLFRRELPNETWAQITHTLIDLFHWEFQETEWGSFLRQEPLERLRRFVRTAREIGIDHVFIMVDRVDEFYGTAGRPERQAELLRPLLASVPLRGIAVFKFFLPRELLPVLRERLGPSEFREDKTPPLEVEWQANDIARLLQTRLKASSKEGRIASFAQLVLGELTDIDEQLVEFAHHSPRDLIRLCSRIFSEHTRVPTEKLYLEPDEILAAKRWFARTRARELYGDEWLAQLIRLPVPFTAGDMSRILNLTPQETEALLHAWQEAGLVQGQRRDPAQPDAAPRFAIADPRARLVWEEEHLWANPNP